MITFAILFVSALFLLWIGEVIFRNISRIPALIIYTLAAPVLPFIVARKHWKTRPVVARVLAIIYTLLYLTLGSLLFI